MIVSQIQRAWRPACEPESTERYVLTSKHVENETITERPVTVDQGGKTQN